ncbi:MAG: type II toxin-antitoxin system RelE/ParE family toxin [Geminicoccaceae bacterium]
MAERPRLTLAVPARRDLVEIWSWIAASSSRARADDLPERLRDSFRLLARNPLIGRERPEIREGVRSFAVVPHVIFYEPNRSGVRVLRVIHGARHLERALGQRPADTDWTPSR